MSTLSLLLDEIKLKHKIFLELKPKSSKELESNLYEWFRVALTYTSNAIEGNTLSHIETAQILEKNITIVGKSLTEHVEAINHAHAIDFAYNLAQVKTRAQITASDILKIHSYILQGINNEYAGVLRNVPVRIMGSTIPIPNYVLVPKLMDDLISWLHATHGFIVPVAADAHLKLAFIHPFIDGNGRTARLLMNLILLQEGFPLAIIKVEDRIQYIKAMQKAFTYAVHNFTAEQFMVHEHNFLAIEEFHDYYRIIFQSLIYSLDEYIESYKKLA